jgi:hypothetical protein
MVNSVLFSSQKDDWETPKSLFNELNDEFNFQIDLCANENNSKCESYCSDIFRFNPDLLTCGFMNPPYGKSIIKYIERAWQLSTKMKVVCLVPARTDTKWWSIFWDREQGKPKPGCKVRFYPYKPHHKSRLKFEYLGIPFLDEKGRAQTAPFPSAVVIMDRTQAIKN